MDSDKKPNVIKAGPMTSFLLDGLQNDTKYKVQVASYGDKRFLNSAPAVITVKTDDDGKDLVVIRLATVGISGNFRKIVPFRQFCLQLQSFSKF